MSCAARIRAAVFPVAAEMRRAAPEGAALPLSSRGSASDLNLLHQAAVLRYAARTSIETTIQIAEAHLGVRQ